MVYPAAAVRLASFLPPGADGPVAGEVRGEQVVAFASGETVRDRLASEDRTRADGRSWPLDSVTLLAPVPDARAVYGIGLNYADHIAETGGQRPAQPIVFTKVPGALAPGGGPIRCPPAVHRLDYEGELCVVVGAEGRAGGFCVADDVSARDLQGREPQWTRAKGADTFCPFGPWVTTADEVADPHRLRLRTWVNGELRQDSNTDQLIFGVPELLAFIGATCTLAPGDLVLTGTPSGVGMGMEPPRFLGSGDRVRIEIEGLGAIEHLVA